MTNKIKLIFVITATVSAVFFVLTDTQFVADITVQVFSIIANAFGLHEASAISASWYWQFLVCICILPSVREDTHTEKTLIQRRHS